VPKRSNLRTRCRRRPGTLCIRRVMPRTPLVVTPMQAVSAGPRRAPRSDLPLTPSSCLTRRLLADAGVPGDDQNKNQVDSLCALRDDDAGEGIGGGPAASFHERTLARLVGVPGLLIEQRVEG
jgi:hypothetical protein